MMFVPTPAFSKPAAGQAPRWDDAQQRFVAASDPVLGTAAYKNVGTGAADVAAGNAPAVAAAAAVVTAEAYADGVGAAAVAAAGAYADGVGAAAVATAEAYADGVAATAESNAEAYADALLAASGRTKIFLNTGLDFNQAATDIGGFAGLPAKYVIVRYGFFDMSAAPSGAGSIFLRTAAGGGGTLVASTSPSPAQTSADKFTARSFDGGAGTETTMTYRTATSLYLYANTSNAAPLTGTAFLEIIDLT